MHLVMNSKTHWQWEAGRVGVGTQRICLSLPLVGPQLPRHSPHGAEFLWIWKAYFLPATANKDFHPLLGRIYSNNPCPFIKGMFVNILVPDSHSCQQMAFSWEEMRRERWLGVSVEGWIRSRVHKQRSSLLSDAESCFPHKSQPHI